ncbi:GntR family transcriptional regulator [Novosphingobium sp. MBES04]|uniref:GntR family transcriptional regulator n=1 Tax=Novosphingobium sp. MBES04 TaxID=1206458 RepID=UPI00069402DE|nr:GntR family transcriptional regulator [Novosphingobium sp. MBES04]
MTKIPSEAVSERVAAILARRILSGELAPGLRIKQDELAAELNTSRIPVRDALRILESRGLVTMRANTGARVVAPARSDIAAAFDIRERLEPLLLADSMANFGAEDVEALRAVVRAGETATTPEDMIEHGREFHWMTYSRHTSTLLATMVERVWDVGQAFVLGTWKAMDAAAAEHARQDHLREHHVLCEAIARRELETAQAALVLHLRRVRAVVLGQVEAMHPAQAARV